MGLAKPTSPPSPDQQGAACARATPPAAHALLVDGHAPRSELAAPPTNHHMGLAWASTITARVGGAARGARAA